MMEQSLLSQYQTPLDARKAKQKFDILGFVALPD
jgi:hypothetical protein